MLKYDNFSSSLTSHYSVRDQEHLDAVGEPADEERDARDHAARDSDHSTPEPVGQGAGDRTYRGKTSTQTRLRPETQPNPAGET